MILKIIIKFDYFERIYLSINKKLYQMDINLLDKINKHKNRHYNILIRLNIYNTIVNYFSILICILSLIDYEFGVFGIINNRYRHFLVGILITLIVYLSQRLFNTQKQVNTSMLDKYRAFEYKLNNLDNFDKELNTCIISNQVEIITTTYYKNLNILQRCMLFNLVK